MKDIDAFNEALEPGKKTICDALRDMFDHQFGTGASRMYHGAPVWFMDGNPVLGYSLKKTGVAVLFWSGQSFREPGLKPVGKYKAAEIIIPENGNIPDQKMELWLNESRTIIWDYKNLVRKKGLLELLES